MTGEKEFIEQLVDAKKLKIYSDEIYKFNRLMAVETGQLMQLDERWTEHVKQRRGHRLRQDLAAETGKAAAGGCRPEVDS